MTGRFSEGMEAMDTGDVDSAVQIFCSYLDTMYRVGAPPCRDMSLCQDALRICLSNSGNTWITRKWRHRKGKLPTCKFNNKLYKLVHNTQDHILTASCQEMIKISWIFCQKHLKFLQKIHASFSVPSLDFRLIRQWILSHLWFDTVQPGYISTNILSPPTESKNVFHPEDGESMFL